MQDYLRSAHEVPQPCAAAVQTDMSGTEYIVEVNLMSTLPSQWIVQLFLCGPDCML